MITENLGKELHILVTDDHQSLRSHMVGYLRAYFTKQGTFITEAGDGKQAVSLVKERIQEYAKSYDLIIMDFQMPHLNGQQATIQIRLLEAYLRGEDMSKIITWSSSWDTPFRGADIALKKRFTPFDFHTTLDALGFIKSTE